MKALVLAGGLPQIALIKELQNRGITTVLCDYYPNPVAKPYADTFYQISTLDIPAITRVAKEEQVDFLITCCTDQALLTVAKVSEELGLPCYIDYQTGLNVTNKQYMKQVFNRFDIPTAKHVIMASYQEELLSGFRFPLIVKPVDCNSSKGVMRCENHEELKPAVEAAIGYSRTNTAIVEEFIDGPELSVDVYVENGTAHILNISQLDKLPLENKFIIFRSKSPASMCDALYRSIQTTAQSIADTFGLKNAPMLIQMISNGQDAFVLEFSARTGGGEKYLMLPKLSGFDPIKAVVDLSLGEKPCVPAQRPVETFFATEFIYCHAGTFHHLENFEKLKSEGILFDYYCFHPPGTEFDKIASSGDRVGGFSLVASSKEKLQEYHEIALRELKVIDHIGADIMRRDLLPDLY